MGHGLNAKEEVYRALAERLNKNPVGTPVNQFLMEILFRLYTETEAVVGSKFPLLPVTIDKIEEITGIDKERLNGILNEMADKGLVIDLPRRGNTYYLLAPMVIGFFEYTFMRVREEVNMKELSELFEVYFRQDEVREELFGGDTKMFKALVYESLIPELVETEVLSYERASEIIRQSGGGAISLCSCRHKAQHLGKACDAPLDVCTSLGTVASWLVRRGLGKPASVDDLLRVLDQTEKHGLVHLGDNVLNNHAYICHCCGCCCEVLTPIKDTGRLTLHPSNFIAVLDRDSCSSCGICEESCQINAIQLKESDDDMPEINQQLCIGCGVCVNSCPLGALHMERRAVLHVPPASKSEQFKLISQEKGRR